MSKARFILAVIMIGVWPAAHAQDLPVEPIGKVTYVSADLVYVDAGTQHGVAVGDQFAFYRKGQWIATLEIVSAAKATASCRIAEGAQIPDVGDGAFLRKKVEREVAPQETETTKKKTKVTQQAPRYRLPVKRLRGSLALQFYEFFDDSGYDRGFRQPALRISLRGQELLGGNYGFRVRTRTRYSEREQPFRSSDEKTEWYNRVYEASVTREVPGSMLSMSLGRILPRGLSPVGPFDGAMFHLNVGSRHRFGLLAGNQPKWEYSDLSTSISKYGVFYRFGARDPSQISKWESSAAVVGEYTDGEINREFVFVNVAYRGEQLYAYQSLELDMNRDWRKDLAGDSTQLTNLYTSLRYQPVKKISVGVSYDTRRNYRTWELLTDDERYFDDLFRRGLRANISGQIGQYLRINANYGIRSREDEEDADSYYLNIYHRRLFIDGLTLNVRAAGFSNGFTEGTNPSVRVGKQFRSGRAAFLSVSRSEYDMMATLETRTNEWIRLDFRTPIGRHWSAFAQYEYNQGDESKGHKVFFEFGYRL